MVGVRPNPRLQRTPLRAPLSRKPLAGRKVLLVLILSGFMVVAGGLSAEAMCANKGYQLKATVRDRYTLAPLAGATLTFFANDETVAWPVDWVDSNPDHYVTDPSGRFSGAFYFSMAKGAFLGMFMNCSGKLKRLTIIATRKGYYGKRLTVRISAIPVRLEGDHAVLELPALELQPAR